MSKNKQFHSQKFDDGTALKLDIFRRYIREWVAVFMTDSPNNARVARINIFDFFAGPGSDKAGNPGSPQIIIEEIKANCAEHGSPRNRPITMYFNDIEADKIATLRETMAGIACGRTCCEFKYSTLPFAEAFEQLYPAISAKGSANLVIMDQFGISDVTPEIVHQLSLCDRTDILFFFPSSYLKRFRDLPSFASKIDLREKNLDFNTIHRYICDYFKEWLGASRYYLAPFSIKSGSNIHGVIFGSGHLYGLEKFLRVCWDIDPQTGEANYNIDNDLVRGGQLSLFEEMNSFRKIDQFTESLKEFIEIVAPDNVMTYEFCLMRGFTPTVAKQVLESLLSAGWLQVVSLTDGKPPRKGAFYLGHHENQPKIQFQKAEGAS